MRLIPAFVVFMLAASGVRAELLDWEMQVYRQDNPDELAYAFTVDYDCPVSVNALRSLIEDVLTRSQLKPLGGERWKESSLSLQLEVYCLDADEGMMTYAVNTIFANWKAEIPVHYTRNFGSFGRGEKATFEGAIRYSVEKAVSAYLEANFDLKD
jgi:hypothetical protein